MLQLTAIVPATNRPETLAHCLAAIECATAGPEQTIVVDDTSIKHAGLARNAGARKASGDVLVFVDADVTVHPDAFVGIRKAFEADPNLVALFGSYDVHQSAAGPASTFWAGLGAVRRDAFEACGGFVEHPIEDIELGMRLSETGARIMLDPAVQGKHLKDWSLWSMLRTDLLVRGIPWVGLLLEHRGSANASALNLGWRHRLSAIASLGLVAAAALRSVSIAIVALVLLLALNLSFYKLLSHREGLPRAIGGVALHFLHHLVAVAALPLGILVYLARRRQAHPHTTTI